ncbi:hypothetical protein NLJ89_g6943 [Agrocybe chaxingu]|uniref:Beta-glucuronidase C-terminal domain-containing protein n=1 Tax=Agrocybe chaxingu TaxID=84603 RepID=A0A9W8MTL2_9AGAR|nr:hypothetical protein NLJ89_g6943 [Agrocybe chaxingu]
MLLSSLVALCATFSTAHAVTVYGQIPLAQTITPTDPAAPAATTLAAYNRTLLNPPALPNPLPATTYELPLQRDAAAASGISIPHVGGGFWGFSIEMSVISQVLGKNSSLLQVPFLNLMANLQERAGGVVIRLGGNTQEFAVMVPELEDGRTFGKTDSGSTQTTKTPAVLYTIDMFYMANNISSMLNVKWFCGIPFNDSVNWRLTIAEEAQNILGDNLLALQAGNEPDFYVEFKRRVAPYEPADYANEVQNLIEVMDNNPRIINKNMLLGPSIASAHWTPADVWATGFIDRFRDRMYAFTVEHYPDNNCAAQFNTGDVHKIPQDVFPSYLDHQKVVELVSPYYDSTALSTAAGKPFFMFETNTASCGGFAGMAWANFTHGMLHVGGQNVFYNPFTAPPTNQSSYNQWTVGSIYYSTIVLAEAFGKTNTSRIVDLTSTAGSTSTPSYAIYENDVLDKVALFNYMDDNTGASNLQVTLTVPNGGTPASVRVKYLEADSVASKDNITWAGQVGFPLLPILHI